MKSTTSFNTEYGQLKLKNVYTTDDGVVIASSTLFRLLDDDHHTLSLGLICKHRLQTYVVSVVGGRIYLYDLVCVFCRDWVLSILLLLYTKCSRSNEQAQETQSIIFQLPRVP